MPTRRLVVAQRLARRVEILGGARVAARDARRTLRTDRPVVVGPWTSEVGFELLYWIPFLRRLRDRGLLDPQRTVAVSRGGVADWYADVAGQYVELHELVASADVVSAASTGRSRKQVAVTAFDRRAVDRALQQLGIGDAAVLHPRLMYRRFRPAWMERVAATDMLAELAFAPLAAPAPFDAVALPPRYVAVSPYASGVLPADGRAVEAFAWLIERLAASVPVVLVRSGLALDDHEALPVPRHADVIDLAGSFSPATNLAAQAAVIAGADALLSTYGGLSYLAVLLGVPAVGVFEQPDYGLVHHRVARAMVAAIGDAELTLVSTQQLTRLASLTG